jgi:hypothetical protein
VRLGIPGFLVSKVSQKVTAPPNCRPQFPLTGLGVGVDGGVDPDPDPDPDADPDPDPDPDAANNTDAEQLALVPPLEPPQLHVHGPEPATDDDVPVEQRLVEGADDAVVPFADPHTPLIATAAAPTATVVLAIGDVPPAPAQASV